MGERFIDPTIYSKAETENEGIPTEMKGDIKEKETENEDACESVVTAQYFENWEEIELEGNHGIKEKIRENILRAERENQEIYESIACDLGIPVEEFKTRLQKKVEDMAEQAEFFIAISPDLLKQVAIVDGRWKSQLETGRSLGASLDPSLRVTMEREMFGFNETESLEVKTDKEVIAKNKEKRPIYGYFSDDKHGGINFSNGKIPPPTNVQNYGRVNIRIKKARALQKATITFYDSFSRGNKWPPTPAIKPHFTSFSIRFQHGSFLEKLKGPSIMNYGEPYTEVQYHGQLTMDDVESVHISKHNGLYPQEIKEVRRIFKKYKKQHPESAITLIEF